MHCVSYSNMVSKHIQCELDRQLNSWAPLSNNIPFPNPQPSRLDRIDLDAVQRAKLSCPCPFLDDIDQPLHTEGMDRGGTHIPALIVTERYESS